MSSISLFFEPQLAVVLKQSFTEKYLSLCKIVYNITGQIVTQPHYQNIIPEEDSKVYLQGRFLRF